MDEDIPYDSMVGCNEKSSCRKMGYKDWTSHRTMEASPIVLEVVMMRMKTNWTTIVGKENTRKMRENKKVQRYHQTKKRSKIKAIMSSREVHAYCQNPENTSVRDKLSAKKTTYNVQLMCLLQQRFSVT